MSTGQCFCGAVHFAVHGPLAPITRCHCTRCRKRFGGAGSAMIPLRPGQLRFTAGRSQLTRYGETLGLGFCALCGATLVAFHGEQPVTVAASALDQDAGLQVGQHIFVGSKAAWHTIAGDAPQHEGAPPVPHLQAAGPDRPDR